MSSPRPPDPQPPPFADLQRWLRLHDLLAGLDPDAPPVARALPIDWQPPVRLAVLAGSFNPLTLAHTALAERARADGGVDAVAFALSARIVNKERITGASLEDRLIALEVHVERVADRGVVMLNRGLYVDQAIALRTTFPAMRDLAFIVGYDKVVQIFDARYYDDRDAALDHLFGLARLLVAPRADQGFDALRDLLDQADNRRFASEVRWLPLADEYTGLSSTEVRAVAANGEAIAAAPIETHALLSATGVYAPARLLPNGETLDAYGLRLALLSVLARTRPWADQAADLPDLLRLTLANDEHGHAFRRWLNQPPDNIATRIADLTAFQTHPARQSEPTAPTGG